MMHNDDEDEEKENSENEQNGDDEINDLRIENELKRIKLSLEHGSDFSLPKEANIPPEIESIWLDYIQKFEDEFAKNVSISVYEFIGSPAYRKVEEIPDEEIEAALDAIIEIMNKYNVIVDTICDVEERELYRFITEELFKHFTNDVRIEGMKHYFIYEEFHPNHEYDIKNHCIDFVNSVLDKEKDWMPDFLGLAKEIETTEGLLDNKVVINKIEVFRDAFSGFSTNIFDVKTITIMDDTAEFNFEIDYIANIEGTVETIEYKGDGSLFLKNENGYWNIYKINVPGFTL